MGGDGTYGVAHLSKPEEQPISHTAALPLHRVTASAEAYCSPPLCPQYTTRSFRASSDVNSLNEGKWKGKAMRDKNN